MANKIKLDLATKYIPPEQRIWAIHAGKNKKFYGLFIDEGKIFLEYPGLNISMAALEDATRIKQHIKMSNAINDYLRKGGPVAPSKNPSSYEIDITDEKELKSDLGNVRNLFARAQVGDLIIVTGYGQYRPVHFGEITTPFNPEDKIALRGIEEAEVQYRSVKWLNNAPQRRDLPEALSRKLENRHAIVQIEREDSSQIFYDWAYVNYVLGTISRVEIDGPDYKGNSPLETSSSQYLIAYFIAAYSALKQNKADLLNTLTIEETIDQFYDSSLVEEFGQEFHSPGKYTLVCTVAALAGFLAAAITAATDETAPLEAYKDKVQIINSKEPNNQQLTLETDNDFNLLLKSLHIDKLQKIDKLGKQAKHNIGLRSPVAKK